jgi:putative tricarboxylic transport membrane protein
MDVLQGLLHGFTVVLEPSNLLYCFIGCLVGTLVGVCRASARSPHCRCCCR